MSYAVKLDWFGDDSEWIEVEAEDFEAALHKVWDEWSPTGWTSALVCDDGTSRSVDMDLDAVDFDSAISD